MKLPKEVQQKTSVKYFKARKKHSMGKKMWNFCHPQKKNFGNNNDT